MIWRAVTGLDLVSLGECSRSVSSSLRICNYQSAAEPRRKGESSSTFTPSRSSSAARQGQRPGTKSPAASASSSRDRPQPRRVPPARDWAAEKRHADLARKREEEDALRKRPVQQASRPVKVKEVKPEDVVIPLPPFITVSDLARVLNVKLRNLQAAMLKAGHTDTRPDLLLPYSDAEILLLDSNATATPLSTSSSTFDIYPRPPAPDSELAERPPVVAIMGHVDHGKTTLLDKLRSASVAAGEAGGITQHVGAFSVKVKGGSASLPSRMITFLDTPGHAAFTKMRGRGAKVTDIVVLVVAADDGVMPQTKEVLEMVKEVKEEEGANSTGGLQLVVALNKIDKPDANTDKVKSQLMSEGVNIEEFGGDIPCVEISGKTGLGLDKLEDNLVAMSEINELKAENKGAAEGYIIESRVERGLGNTAVVLIKRGVLQVGDYILAGLGWCKVRRLMDSSGKVAIKKGMPGDAVLVTGWRDLPNAGDLMLGVEDSKAGEKAEELVKKCLDSRRRVEEKRRLGEDVVMINQHRKVEAEERERQARQEFEERRRNRLERMKASGIAISEEELQQVMAREGDTFAANDTSTSTHKELRLVIRGDYSGTVEAVVGAISGIGNDQVKVKVVHAGIGEPTEGDIAMAQAVEGQIVGFNVKASRSLQNMAQKVQPSVKIHCDNVIYRLMTYVTEQCAALLPPIIQPRVVGEAVIQEVFTINVKGRTFHKVAGCRVTNGTVSKNQLVRVMRAETSTDNDGEEQELRKIIYEGRLGSLMQVKKEVEEMKRGTECGMSFVDYQNFQKGDFVQSYYNEEVSRTL